VLLLLPAGARAEGRFAEGVHAGRAYRLWVPSARAADGPLVVALHGCWQTPEDMALGTRLNEAAERRGLLALYPAQGRYHNAYRCWNWFEPESQAGQGETAEILALARRVQADQRLAGLRLVVLGFSAGGFMAVNLACAAPDLVAGVGVAAGGPFRCGVGPEAAIHCMRGLARDGTSAARGCAAAAGGRRVAPRVSLWHGAFDPVVSPANLTGLETMFARLLEAPTALTEGREGAVHAVYRDARGTAVLETWLVAGMGHAWSGGDPRATHTFPPGPRATERMLDFLLGSSPR
jgi:poly(hydroxyalkanoate) depolymerase family esterase